MIKDLEMDSDPGLSGRALNVITGVRGKQGDLKAIERWKQRLQ